METTPHEIKPRGRVENVVWKLGGITRLAAVLDVSKQAVWKWQVKDSIPSRWQSKLLAIAERNGIELKAEDLIG